MHRGKPGMIVRDDDTQQNSNAVLASGGEMQVEWHYITPGKPMPDGYVERLVATYVMSCSTSPCS